MERTWIRWARNILFVALAVFQLAPVHADPSAQRRAAAAELDLRLAPIKSRADLDRYVALTPARLSPLTALSAEGRSAFLNSLTFNERGLTGYNYAALRSELSPTQASSILALFGARDSLKLVRPTRVLTETDRELLANPAPFTICEDCEDPPPEAPGNPGAGGGGGGGGSDPNSPRDYEDYRCAAKATCSRSPTNICMRSC